MPLRLRQRRLAVCGIIIYSPRLAGTYYLLVLPPLPLPFIPTTPSLGRRLRGCASAPRFGKSAGSAAKLCLVYVALHIYGQRGGAQ